jgi:hypothetical protein
MNIASVVDGFGGPQYGVTRSPYLSPLDFQLWENVKELMYRTKRKRDAVTRVKDKPNQLTWATHFVQRRKKDVRLRVVILNTVDTVIEVLR